MVKKILNKEGIIVASNDKNNHKSICIEIKRIIMKNNEFISSLGF